MRTVVDVNKTRKINKFAAGAEHLIRGRKGSTVIDFSVSWPWPMQQAAAPLNVLCILRAAWPIQ